MSNTTKRALEESLKKLLLSKPLDKITINDLTTDCGISRMTFYYHFQDIPSLLEEIIVEMTAKSVEISRLQSVQSSSNPGHLSQVVGRQ